MSGAAAVVLYSLFEEQLRQDRLELSRRLESGTDSFAEALTLFSGAGRIPPRPGGISQAHRRREEGRANSRSSPASTASSNGGWTILREANPTGRRGRAGAEHLLHPHEPGTDRHGSRADLPRHFEGGEGGGDDSCRREIKPVLQQFCEHGKAAGSGRRKRAGVVQPLLPAGHRTGNTRGEAEHFVEHADGDAPAAALDRAAARPDQRQPRGDQRHSSRRRTCSKCSWPARM